MDGADSLVRRVVWNEDERRIRAPWRLAIGLTVIVVAAIGGSFVGAGLVAPAKTFGGVLRALVATGAFVVRYAAVAAGVLLVAWAVDRRRLRDLGLALSRRWWADLAFGTGLGVLMPGVVFLLERGLGYVAVTRLVVSRSGTVLPPASGVPFALAFAVTVVYFLAVGVVEELVFRGYLLTNVAEGLRGVGLGTRGALAVAVAATSVLFGLVHGANPNATWIAVLLITLFGALLGSAYVLTDRLAVPIGIHVAWNLSVSSVYGFPVSGVKTPVTLVDVEQSGPVLLTGGAFGPEGGLLSLAALAVGVALLSWWVRHSNGRVPLRESVARLNRR